MLRGLKTEEQRMTPSQFKEAALDVTCDNVIRLTNGENLVQYLPVYVFTNLNVGLGSN